jgi:hypothetical protein
MTAMTSLTKPMQEAVQGIDTLFPPLKATTSWPLPTSHRPLALTLYTSHTSAVTSIDVCNAFMSWDQ